MGLIFRLCDGRGCALLLDPYRLDPGAFFAVPDGISDIQTPEPTSRIKAPILFILPLQKTSIAIRRELLQGPPGFSRAGRREHAAVPPGKERDL